MIATPHKGAWQFPTNNLLQKIPEPAKPARNDMVGYLNDIVLLSREIFHAAIACFFVILAILFAPIAKSIITDAAAVKPKI